jgi:hypothetical protein
MGKEFNKSKTMQTTFCWSAKSTRKVHQVTRVVYEDSLPFVEYSLAPRPGSRWSYEPQPLFEHQTSSITEFDESSFAHEAESITVVSLNKPQL